MMNKIVQFFIVTFFALNFAVSIAKILKGENVIAEIIFATLMGAALYFNLEKKP